MTSLVYLSNELLYKVCVFTDCEDLRAFSVVNRRLYMVAKPILDKHRLLWDKFEAIEDGPQTGFWFWHNFTLSMLSGSPGASYVRHIKSGYLDRRNGRDRAVGEMVKDWDVESDSEISTIFQHRNKTRVLARRIRTYSSSGWCVNGNSAVFDKAIKNGGWITDRQKRLDLEAPLFTASQPVIRGILLPLLPNLRTLKIGRSSSWWQRRLELAVRRAAIAHSLNQPCLAFGRLTSVNLNGEHNSRGEYSLEFLASLMALPSMRKIAANIVRAETFIRPPLLPPSSVVDITVLEQAISPEAFANLLEGGAPLVSLHLEVCGGAKYFHDGKFGGVLLENARHSLEKLKLLRDAVGGVMNGIELQAFKKLEQLDISYECLYLGSDRTLADVLPRSLRKFALRAVRYEKGILQQLLQILAQKENPFPNLEELFVDSWLEGKDVDALEAACEERRVAWIQSKKHQVASSVGIVPPLTGRPRLVLPLI